MILPVNIRLIRKNLQEVNTLAYFAQMAAIKENTGSLINRVGHSNSSLE